MNVFILLRTRHALRFLPVIITTFSTLAIAWICGVLVTQAFLEKFSTLGWRDINRLAVLLSVVIFLGSCFITVETKKLLITFARLNGLVIAVFTGFLEGNRWLGLFSLLGGALGLGLLGSRRFSRAMAACVALTRARQRKTEQLAELKLAEYMAFVPYITRFTWVLGLVCLSAILSLVIAIPLLLPQFFAFNLHELEFILSGQAATVLVLSWCCFLQFRGHIWPVWILFLSLIASFSINLMLLQETRYTLVALLALGVCVLGLWVISSRKYRRAISVMLVRDRVRRRLTLLERQLLSPAKRKES
ncbi:hypothetical protein HX776_21910 [Pseudomonas agarici]|uniref:hypothetical protein n=1 Tax=Pseudomonas agarici TaxID=46677 RepID=UPI0003757CF8|nr:hypothetical protein [Pseudomonas agarici]NWC11450.1 hypothetical protein [Pseudomonas agarici]SEK98785.1 hypothetical protein SAMN05216604_10978 [Pseudomonas agarici]